MKDKLNDICFRLTDEISDSLSKCGLMYRIFSRVKTVDSIRHKLNVKYADKKVKIQDMIGIRIVLYFQDDVDALAVYYSAKDVMKKFFADATFAADGKLNHTLEGETKVKNYTLNGNNLVFNLYEGSDTYKVNATSFPDEDGDRLFIIIPKQAAWLGGMVDLVEKENEGLTLNAAQIAALEKEFMETFETFTVILSLSKK